MGADSLGKRKDRENYANSMINLYSQKRPVLIDVFGPDCIQNTIGGKMPNSAFIINKERKMVLWQEWSNPAEIRAKLEEMTGN